MPQDLRIDRSDVGSFLKVDVSGTLNEALVPEHLANLGDGRPVRIDLEKVSRITSFGVRQWVRGLEALRQKSAGLVLERCSYACVSQLNLISTFSADALILSVMAPVRCESCEHERLVVVDVTNGPPTSLEQPCVQCGAKADLEEDPDTYFAFVKAHDLSGARAALYEKLMADAEGGGTVAAAPPAEERTQVVSEAELKARAEREATARAEDEAKERTAAEAKARAEAEAKARAEAEAKARAEAEAKARAEAEAKARAEAEEKARADAQALAEAAAKTRAEAEAKARVEAEAKARAEAEAKARAEAEAKTRSDAETLARAAAEAMALDKAEAAARAMRLPPPPPPVDDELEMTAVHFVDAMAPDTDRTPVPGSVPAVQPATSPPQVTVAEASVVPSSDRSDTVEGVARWSRRSWSIAILAFGVGLLIGFLLGRL